MPITCVMVDNFPRQPGTAGVVRVGMTSSLTLLGSTEPLRFRPRFLAKTDQIRWLLQSRCTPFSPPLIPWAGSSSAMNRYPNARSSRWMSRAALIRCASALPVGDRVDLPFVERLLEEAKHPQVTATGIPLAARSRTSGKLILGAAPWRRTPRPGAGSRSPAQERRIRFFASRNSAVSFSVTPGLTPSSI
jgi:hypothetical protein